MLRANMPERARIRTSADAWRDVSRVTAADVCVPGYAHRVRNVPIARMRAVDEEYRIRYVRGESEIDHISSRSSSAATMASATSRRNSQRHLEGAAQGRARRELHDRVCSGELTLDERSAASRAIGLRPIVGMSEANRLVHAKRFSRMARGRRVDFKETLSSKLDGIVETCCAFANAYGGVIVIGFVDPDRTSGRLDRLRWRST